MKVYDILLALATSIVATTVLAGCSTAGTAIPIGDQSQTFAPTDHTKIALLIEPPAKTHEIIALVEGVAATDDYLTEARTQEAALNAMKKAAAQLGANAIVLTGKGKEPYGQMTIVNTSANASATAIGDSVALAGYATSVGQTVGWEKFRFAGTAIRYKDQ
jgi:hypothetical protein